MTVISQQEAQNPYVVVNGPGESKEKVNRIVSVMVLNLIKISKIANSY